MRTLFTKLMAALTLLSVVNVGCKKHEETKAPTVTIVEDSVVVTHNSAMLFAKVTDKGGADVTECGFCYAKQGEIFDTLFCAGSNDLFSVELTDLSPSTAYSCKAFADNAAGRGYSETFSFTTLDTPAPVVKTFDVTNITPNSAMAHGQVVSDGGLEVIERGVCYDFGSHPTIEDAHIACGSGIGRFDCQLTGLPSEQVYYIRAYAVCAEGVYYGNEKVFGTSAIPLEVHTIKVSDVTSTRVEAFGRVSNAGGYEVTERGFCWSTEPNPTIENRHVWAGTGMGDYSWHFSGLERGVTHYVRAYAINENEIAYGEELEFIPTDIVTTWPDGVLPGSFSVSEDRKVRFSQGNLQYNPSGGVWRFAEYQWDFVGGESDVDYIGTVYENGVRCDNSLVSVNYSGWVDLFGWGTSGWDNGNVYYQPYDYSSHSNVSAFYGPPGNYDLTGEYAQSDWGSNSISNGSSRQWRTITAEELYYLLFERATPSYLRFVKAKVAGVRGMILLPDDWSPATYYFRGVNLNIDYSVNLVPGRDWLDVLEPAGAVFLPAAGYRFNDIYWNGISLSQHTSGSYWTSTQGTSVDSATEFYFEGCEEGSVAPDLMSENCFRSNGNSVRLISDE